MKKKTLITLIIAVIVTLLGLILYFERSNLKELKALNASDIKEIFIAHPVGYYTITQQEDIQILLDALKSIDNIRKLQEYKDGGMIIDLTLNDGEIIEISLRSNDIIIDGQHYKQRTLIIIKLVRYSICFQRNMKSRLIK